MSVSNFSSIFQPSLVLHYAGRVPRGCAENVHGREAVAKRTKRREGP